MKNFKLKISLTVLKRMIIFFWALWFTIVFLTNFCDALKALGVLSKDWKFASGNWALMLETTQIYHIRTPVIGFLFVIIIAWEALCMVLMWRALQLFKSVRDPYGLSAIDIAFIAGLLLFIGFMIADELLIAYLIEGTHMHIFLTLLVSMLMIHSLPDDRRTRSLQSRTQ